MPTLVTDAVVIGGGHHGLVAAAVLADAGWDVCVLESADVVGGAVRSARLHPDFITDLFSAFYPLSAASPVLRALELERHGLRWAHAPNVLAHPPRPDGGPAAVLHRDREQTAAGLAVHDPRDGEAWLRLCRQWDQVGDAFLRSLFTAFPPVRGPLQLLRRIGTADALRLARFLALPAGRMGEELFASEQARLLLAGNAVHGDTPPDATVSGVFGWLLAMLGQQYGFPVPAGGAGELAAALHRRAAAAGADVRTGEHVERIDVRAGRAVAVHTAGGLTVRARRAVVADVAAPALYGHLLDPGVLPSRLLADLQRFVWDTPVVKVNWALAGPIPWRSPDVAGAGTVHLGADVRGLLRWSADIESGTVPASPFVLLGQMTTTDPSRSPAGTESAWAYTHLPRGVAHDAAADELAGRVDAVLEKFAPGFGDRVLHRVVQRPRHLQDADPNLVDGAVNSGTAQLFQQLVFRPVPGLGRAETVIDGLYLGSASAHPGGGVHGVCGWLAARAALGEHGAFGALRRRVTSAALELLYRDPRPRP
ncbi:phytoene desaturase family protein [Pseudonocardia alaniniphila]|uniref:Pyridine nucleotide-disulfide oxidoreductase domain-containing protein 2 n=1 Tax=Pseudonocardia alaniniphila TaxID=75291 RepID=A0ABS9TUI7_9PSEU|nr:NAD(P)/FAD-dependent oxidoreductase [Pseudonocardia alaniniphila]MCH6172232.1 NAD(P)/FAD-dependent oxidoreductase [Pseudonocardia alaniniphila]